MARRGKSSAAELLMEVVAKLPWWACVALAIASYVWLSDIAARPTNGAATGAPVSSLVTAGVVHGLAAAGQYLLPFICLGAAGLSAFRNRQRKQLFAQAAQSPTASAVDGMQWQEFEMLVGEAFRRQGYRVVETGGGGADGGVDLVLSKPTQNGTEKTLVQCKQWRAFKVGVEFVRELYGVMAARGAAAGIVVTSGRFTAEAQAFAQGRNVRLIDGPALQVLIREAREQTPGRATGGTAPMAQPAAAQRPSQPQSFAAGVPDCPACGKPMVQRTAKRGAQAGSSFWGCTGYPACRGTRRTTDG